MNLLDIFEQIKWMPSFDIKLIDIIQMVILALCVYYLAKSLYKTRAWILVKGLAIIGVVYLMICVTEMTVLKLIVQSLFSSLLIAIVIMLQPELQKLVELIGKRRLTDFKSLLRRKADIPTWYTDKDIYEIASACEDMSAVKTGALIVLERAIPLEEYSESGIGIGANISNQLLINIFEKNTPLHDGAVIIKNNKVEAATCYLPLSSNPNIAKSFGTRHRAALGISETTDCIVVVVSEETGDISVCYDGKIKHAVDRATLTSILKSNMYQSEDIVTQTKKKQHKTPLWIKIAAPIISFIVWISVLSATDPIVTRVIQDVDVVAINTEVLDDHGQAYFIKSGDVIDVTVKGRRSLVDSMSSNDITAVADFTNMSIVYAVPIEIEGNGRYSSVEIMSKQSHLMKLELEDLVQTEIPIEVELVGNVDANYVVSLQNIETSMLTVTCTQSLAETLDKAVLKIDAYGKQKDFVSVVKPFVYDKNGKQISESKISLNYEQIRVSMNVYEVQEIPIEIDLIAQDKTGDYYYILNSLKSEHEFVRIAGANSSMDGLDVVHISITPDANSESIGTVLIGLKQYLPEGVMLAIDQDDQITVELDLTKYQKMTIPLKSENIGIVNGSGHKLSTNIVRSPKELIMYYNTSVVDPSILTLATLNPIVKVQESSVGQYSAILSFTDIEGVEVVGDNVVHYVLTK